MKDKEVLISRLRQLLAADKNAVGIYSDLEKSIDETSLKGKLADLVNDEKRHCVLIEKALSLLEE